MARHDEQMPDEGAERREPIRRRLEKLRGYVFAQLVTSPEITLTDDVVRRWREASSPEGEDSEAVRKTLDTELWVTSRLLERMFAIAGQVARSLWFNHFAPTNPEWFVDEASIAEVGIDAVLKIEQTLTARRDAAVSGRAAHGSTQASVQEVTTARSLYAVLAYVAYRIYDSFLKQVTRPEVSVGPGNEETNAGENRSELDFTDIPVEDDGFERIIDQDIVLRLVSLYDTFRETVPGVLGAHLGVVESVYGEEVRAEGLSGQVAQREVRGRVLVFLLEENVAHPVGGGVIEGCCGNPDTYSVHNFRLRRRLWAFLGESQQWREISGND